MKTNSNTLYIQKLISEGEHIHQDFKFAISDARKIAKSLSAFANTEGGRLLVGVKDNGKIAGVRSEEEIYMVEAAATLYCRPEIELETHIYHIEGKDVLEVQINGKIAGVRSEEEIYMVEAAATLYCRPEIELETHIYHIEGKDVLEVQINESTQKPIYALDENNHPWAYVRIKDENILVETHIYHIEGKDVLEVQINESTQKPIYALDENNHPWAYVRIKDENILGNPIHLNIWKHDREEKKVIITYTQREQQVLTILKQQGALTLGQCSKLTRMNRKQISRLLADFIRFGLVEQYFEEHTFYFRLKDGE